MTIQKVCFILLTVFMMTGWVGGAASAAPAMDTTVPEALILNPGSAASCPHDFVLENTQNEAVELQLMLGNEDFKRDKIEANDAKAYGLRHHLAEAKMQGKHVDMNDWATVFNLGENVPIKMFCLQ